MIIQEFEHKGNGKYEVREYDPLSDHCLDFAMQHMHCDRQGAIDYANKVIEAIEKAGGTLFTPNGFILRAKKEGENLEEVAKAINFRWN